MSDLMSERYGTASPARRRAVVLASGLVGVVALAWLAWVMWFQSNPDISSSLRTFEVLDAHSARATVVLRVDDASVDADCLVRAYAADRSVVGELDFPVSGVSGTVVRTVTVRTERKASAVEMVGCTTPDQSRPR